MRVLALVCLVALTVVGAGCEQKTESTEPTEKRTFALISMVESDLVATGAKHAAEPGTTITASVARTAAEQVKLLNDIAAAKNVDGVAIDCVASPEVTAAVTKCVQAGIPVVTYNGDCLTADSGRHCFVGTQLEEIGRALGHEMCDQLRPKETDSKSTPRATGVIALISGPDSPNQALIEKGIKDCLDSASGVRLLDPVRPDVTVGAVTQAMVEAQQREPNINAFIILNPAAAPDAEAAPLKGLEHFKIVMLGSNPATFDAVAPEKVDVLVSVPFAEYGSAVVQILDGITRSGQIYANVVHIGPAVVTVENVKDVATQRQSVASGEVKAVVVPAGGVKPVLPKVE